jgi:hypothetical protein
MYKKEYIFRLRYDYGIYLFYRETTVYGYNEPKGTVLAHDVLKTVKSK